MEKACIALRTFPVMFAEVAISPDIPRKLPSFSLATMYVFLCPSTSLGLVWPKRNHKRREDLCIDD